MMGGLRTVHAWAGAILSLLLIMLGLTGTLLVFEDDWIRLSVPGARAEAVTDAAQLGAVTERLEFEHDGLRAVAFAGGTGVHKVYLERHRFAYADRAGATVVAWTGAARPEAFVFELHHELMAGETGKYVIGTAALAAILLVLTGLVVWAPAWRATRARIWPRSTRRGDMVSSHRNLGLFAALPILVFCVTGAGMVFNDTAQALLSPGAPPPTEPPRAGTGDIDWPTALVAAQARFPDATLRSVRWPAAPGKPATVRLRQPQEWHPNGRTYVQIDPATGTVVQVTDAQSLPRGIRLTHAFYPVHAATIGGWPYKLVSALSGLALVLLGGLGTWSFLFRPRRKRRAARTPVT